MYWEKSNNIKIGYFCGPEKIRNRAFLFEQRFVRGPFLKGVVSFFFFVKILINRGGRTRMYPPYKNAYKRPFCSNIKALTRRKNERFYEYFILVVILESCSPGSVVLEECDNN